MSRQLIVVGGPNGAGKTTLALEYRSQTGARYIAADDIATSLAPNAPESARIEAGRQFIVELTEALESGVENLLVESTLSGKSFSRLLAHASQLGYQTRLLLITLESPEACIERVRERVSKGGHHVPEADVRRRFQRSHKNFWDFYRFQVDSWHLYLNSDERLSILAFGASDDIEIQEPPAFELFLHQSGVHGNAI